MTWLLIVIVFLVVLLAIWQTFLLRRIRRRVEAVPDDGNVFVSLQQLGERTRTLEHDVGALEPRVTGLEQRLPLAVSRTGVVTFDAFGNIAGQLSRSIALLNERGDGIIVTILVARDETRFFVKQVRSARGSEPLAPEEQAAVDRAMSG